MSTANTNSVNTSTPVAPTVEDPSAGYRSFRITCGANFNTRLPGAREEVACGESSITTQISFM
jgi:hypothetical protein